MKATCLKWATICNVRYVVKRWLLAIADRLKAMLGIKSPSRHALESTRIKAELDGMRDGSESKGWNVVVRDGMPQ